MKLFLNCYNIIPNKHSFSDISSMNATWYKIILLAGNYSYNPALGSFGGYEINFNIDTSIYFF